MMMEMAADLVLECQATASAEEMPGAFDEGVRQEEVAPPGAKEGCLSYLSYNLQVLLYSLMLLPHRLRTTPHDHAYKVSNVVAGIVKPFSGEGHN